TLLLTDEDYPAAEAIATVINNDMSAPVAAVADSRRVELALDRVPAHNTGALLTRIQMLPVTIRPKAKVVVNERTGTVVIGKDVKLGAVSILHGNLAIEIATQFGVSQPQSFSQGETVPLAQPSVKAEESKA